MIAHEGITQSDLEAAFTSAHIPEDAEILESFEIAKARVLEMMKS